MGWEAWYTLLVVAMVFAALVFTRAGPDVALCGGLTLLVAAGTVSLDAAFSGFANEAVLTVAVLFVVASAMTETGAIGLLLGRWLGRPKSAASAQFRVMAPVAVLSAFLNNTPLVAIMLPEVKDLAKKCSIPVSKLMIPLSYAAVLGGVCTLIGTSTNLVVNGLLRDETGEALGIFSIAPIGIPLAVVGIAYTIVAGRWLLPDRRPAIGEGEDPREYTIEMEVAPGGPLVGRTIEKAGLRHLPGAYLLEIDREGEILQAVAPTEILRAGDRLVFAGVVESVVDLQKIRGLVPATDQVFKLDAPREQRCLIEAVVANACPLVGTTIRAGRFRNQYNAAVVAVARHGKRINRKIGDIVLQAGDTLLVEAHPSFAERHRNSRDFYLVSAVRDSAPPRHDKAWLALAILLAMVAVSASGLRPILVSAMLASGLLILTRCVSGRQARRSVDWQTLVSIAASFGIGRALKETGAADGIAASVLGIAGTASPWVALALVYFLTTCFTEVITNNAAAALLFPIGVATAERLDVSPIPFAVAIMMAASAAFATPIGYQTHLMVYGPGGYRFSDFLKFGIPLNFAVGVVAVALVPLVFPFG